MISHIRASLCLLFLTLLVCSVLYPLTLWGIGRMPMFRDKAQGSLILDKEGKIIGSRLIGQRFTADEYFQPRPSATAGTEYNSMASSGSNWGVNNYLLRDRVARALGPIVKYGKGAEKIGKRPGDGVQDDIEAWFGKDRYQDKPGIVVQWTELHAGLAEAWIKSTGDAVKDQWKTKSQPEAFVRQWQADFAEQHAAWIQSDAYREWRKQNLDEAAPAPADLVKPFFESFAKKFPGEWPKLEDYETKDKEPRKRLAHLKKDTEIQQVFFDMWRQEHADIPLEDVPGDMVMASGSGLDPHITLDNARYQLKYRVAAAQAEKLVLARAEPILKTRGSELTDAQRKEILAEVRKAIEVKLGGDLEGKIRPEIDKLLESRKEAPFNGLVGVPLVNVLELNVALQETMENFAK
jgi:K+-transporting ATPase ATPase C chain